MSRRKALGGLAAGVALLTVLAVLDRHPVRWPTRGPEGAAELPLRENAHPVLLLVDVESYRGSKPSSPRDRPPDLEWINILEQMFGGCDVRKTESLAQLGDELLSEREIIVLPRHALASLDSTEFDRLAPHVRRGAVVMLESPEGAWARRFGLASRGTEERPRLPWPFPQTLSPGEAFLPGPSGALRFPHRVTRYWPVGSRDAAQPALTPAGRTIAWEKRQGLGTWLLFAMHVGELSLALRQGKPGEDFRLEQRHTEIMPGPLETNDLVVSPQLLQADHPWLDAWLHALLTPEASPRPWPRVWPAPFAADGWLLLSHDDEGFGDASRWMTRAQHAAGVPSTVFLMPSDGRLTSEGVNGLLADGADVGLHPRWPSPTTWDDPRAPRALWGVWKVQPLGRLPSVREQRDQLASLMPDETVPRLNRNHFLLWPSDPDRAWRRLVGAGMRADSSFGPDWGACGWLFGSTVPFRPLDRRGLVFPLWEVPFLAAETIGGMDRARLRRWLATNAAGSHGPIHLLFHPDAYGWIPSEELFELWEAAPTLARDAGHHPASVSQLLDFWEARGRVRMRWRMSGPMLYVTVQSGADVATRPDPDTAPTPSANGELALTVPLRWKNSVLSSWDASWTARARRARSFEGEVLVLSLPAQVGTLEVRYREVGRRRRFR